ncbi:VOC family protein [Nocardiopsis mangrovi]|uniref:VOC family protein n=1 Tax=Nocardiopsis mangrovi TaxID=1179818 RepID=A0ABV9DWT4_9ACTN
MNRSAEQRHHALDYIEFSVTDLEEAKRFYTKAFGWRFNDYGPMYAGIQGPDGGEVGGLNPNGGARGGSPFVLLFSTDLDRSVEAVTRAGGRIVKEPYAFPGGRRFHFADPSGNELGVFAES